MFNLPRCKFVLTLDGNDELGNDGEDLCPAMLKHVVHALPSKELVGVCRFTESVKEQRQIVVVV